MRTTARCYVSLAIEGNLANKLEATEMSMKTRAEAPFVINVADNSFVM